MKQSESIKVLIVDSQFTSHIQLFYEKNAVFSPKLTSFGQFDSTIMFFKLPTHIEAFLLTIYVILCLIRNIFVICYHMFDMVNWIQNMWSVMIDF